MLELLDLYRVQFKEREPVIIAALCMLEAIERVYLLDDFAPSELVSISSINLQCFV